MKNLLRALVLSTAIIFATAGTAAAWNPFGGINCSGKASSSAVCTDSKTQANNPNQNPLTGSDGLLLKVANIIAVLAGLAAVIIIVLSGLRFIQSGGSAEDIAGARRSLIYAIVGIVVIVLARTILGFVLNALQ